MVVAIHQQAYDRGKISSRIQSYKYGNTPGCVIALATAIF
jgi:hypothetical protein